MNKEVFENELQMGTEDYVEILNNDSAECSLSGTVIDDKVLFIVEDGGAIEEYESYSEALNDYVRKCFLKINGAKTSIS